MVSTTPRVVRAFQLATVDKASAENTPAAFDPLAGENAPLILNNAGKLWVPQRARPRRNRKV
jgi:porphobilinogen synthase